MCLFDAKEVSLRDRIRAGASDEDLLQAIGTAVKGKAEKHAVMDDIDVITNRPMILIGGCACMLLHNSSNLLTEVSQDPALSLAKSSLLRDRRTCLGP